jgi:hypothetical protein
MKLSNIDVLEEVVTELGLDLEALAEEHNQYCMNSSITEEEALNWLHSLPIETLSDSLNKEHQRPRTKYSLHDIHHKSSLRKLHEKKKEELEIYQIKLRVAKIDLLLKVLGEK